jgi:mono/diheme cytochrome c family protein
MLSSHLRWLPFALLAGLCACDAAPARPRLSWSLDPATTAVDPETGEPRLSVESTDVLEAEILRLFGTPAAPRYALLEAWQSDAFDPNAPRDGHAPTAEADLLLARSNEQRFDAVLQAIASTRPGPWPVPDSASSLAARLGEARGGAGDLLASVRARIRAWRPTLADSAELYRPQCLHCHGASGAGDGPTALGLDPRPRDFRPGVFKFTALTDKSVPRRRDLVRVLGEGLPGTAMPSFARFSQAELEGLADYVRLLALRGMVERELVFLAQEEGELTRDMADESYAALWERWRRADQKLIPIEVAPPERTQARIERGQALFHDVTRGNCASCHGIAGEGLGPSAWQLDERGEWEVALTDDWGQPIRPRDLRREPFRGGRRPADLFRRLWSGVNGTPMPAIGDARDASGELLVPSEDLWCLVFYVQALAEGDG